jgi:hypothetical protein
MVSRRLLDELGYRLCQSKNTFKRARRSASLWRRLVAKHEAVTMEEKTSQGRSGDMDT